MFTTCLLLYVSRLHESISCVPGAWLKAESLKLYKVVFSSLHPTVIEETNNIIIVPVLYEQHIIILHVGHEAVLLVFLHKLYIQRVKRTNIEIVNYWSAFPYAIKGGDTDRHDFIIGYTKLSK